jgi:hypothetical protein
LGRRIGPKNNKRDLILEFVSVQIHGGERNSTYVPQEIAMMCNERVLKDITQGVLNLSRHVP